jgi:hypothetical protein
VTPSQQGTTLLQRAQAPSLAALLSPPRCLQYGIYAPGDIGGRRCLTYVGAEDARATRGEGLQITPARGKGITLIECISASGSTLAPYVIYKGSGPNQAWVVVDEPFIGPDWSFAASKSR